MPPFERWRPIDGFPHHEASSLGRVRSLPRDIRANSRGGNLCKRRIAGKILTPKRHKNGYDVVHMAPGSREALVSRLVCTAFHGPAPATDDEADHENRIRHDNRAENLRWLSLAKNRALRNHARGSRQGSAKLDEAKVATIRERLKPAPTSSITARDEALAAEFGVSRRAIGMIRSGKTWSHVNV